MSWAHERRDDDPRLVAKWQETVFRFAHQLRKLGIDVDMDLFHLHDDDVDWSCFGQQGIEKADYVLIVTSAAYKTRWEGSGDPRRGAGAAREANVLKAHFDNDREIFRKRVKLILLPDVGVTDAPVELQSSIQRFPIASLDLAGLSDLLRTLAGRPEWPKPDLGPIPHLPPRAIQVLPEESTSDGNVPMEGLTRIIASNGGSPRSVDVHGEIESPCIDQTTQSSRASDHFLIQLSKSLFPPHARRGGRPRTDGQFLGRLVRDVRAKTLAAALAIVALIVVTISITIPHGRPRATRFTSGALVLRPGSGWRHATSTVPGLSVARQIAITRAGVEVNAGELSHAAQIPGAIPSTLLRAHGRPTLTSIVPFSLGSAKSYQWVENGRGTLSVLIAVTEVGEFAVACTGSATSRTTAEICDAVGAGSQVVGGAIDYPGVDPGVATQLTEILSARATSLARASRHLDGTTLSARSTGLDQMAAVDEHAAQALRGVNGPARDNAALAEVGTRLHSEAALLWSMAVAARRTEITRFDTLRMQLISAPVSVAGAALSALGFGRLRLPALAIPRATRRNHVATAVVVATATVPTISHSVPVRPVSTVQAKPRTTPRSPTANRTKPVVIVSMPE